MSVTRYYARHLRVITVLQTITLQLRIVTRKVRGSSDGTGGEGAAEAAAGNHIIDYRIEPNYCRRSVLPSQLPDRIGEPRATARGWEATTRFRGRHTYLVQPAARADSLKELCVVRAQRAKEFSAAAEAIFGWGCKWMLILLRLRGDSQPEPEFSGFFVHTYCTSYSQKPAPTPESSWLRRLRPPCFGL
jgi:hypothetical protein